MRSGLVLTTTLLFAAALPSYAFGQAPKPVPPPTTQATPAAPAPSPAAPAPNPATPADQNAAKPQAAANGTQAQAATNKKVYCPPVSQLKKIDLFWGAPGGWRSYSQSFVSKIDGFSGAQWIGINVGKMLCVYKSKETFEFPVVLQNDTLTPVPKGENWIKQQGGYYNCLASDRLECPFILEEKKEAENLHKELDFFKGKKDYLKDNLRP